jgi:hypothetical protein
MSSFITRPINSLAMNSVVDGRVLQEIHAFIMFKKGHPYLNLCLKEYYQSSDWTASGPDIY